MKMKRFKKLTSVILALLLISSCAPAAVDSASSTSAKEEWKLGAPVIPENNPDPVLVNREDAAIPTPISYTDKIVGEEMDVEIKSVTIHGTPKRQWNNHIAIIRSFDEIKAIYDQDNKCLNTDEHYLNFYNSEHFADNIIIMLLFYNGSSAFRYKIDKVTMLDGRMYIYRNNIDLSADSIYSQDETYSRTFISISENDMDNITDVVVYEDEIFRD